MGIIEKKGGGGMLEFQNPDEMDMRSSRQYLIAIIANLKQIKEKQKKLRTDLETWNKRITLARGNNRSDLEATAVQKAEDIKYRLQTLSTEEAELVREAARMKSRIGLLRTEVDKTVNTDMLLSELEMLVGEPDILSGQFEEEEAEETLKKLKKDLGLSE